MKEIYDIAAAFRECCGVGIDCALATVVDVHGSSYRKPGARMLVTSEGVVAAGCISGGCLEADIAQWAVRCIESNLPKLVVYDTMSDQTNDDLFGLGTGCVGIIKIFVEPLNPKSTVLQDAVAILDSGSDVNLITVYDGASGQLFGTSVEKDIVMECDVCFFRHHVEPSIKLILCGSGPDTEPLVQMAATLGWQTTVVGKPGAPNRLSTASLHFDYIHAEPDELGSVVSLTAHTAVAVMTHNYLLDLQFLRGLVDSDVFYIGVLGSHDRIGRALSELRQCLSSDQRRSFDQRLHAPIGLDLGGDTPELIALSIVSEIQAVRSGRMRSFARREAAPGRISVRSNRTRSRREMLRCPTLV